MQKHISVAPLLALAAATLAIPASAIAATPQGPTPAGNPGEWVTTGDYPADALQAGATGTVKFRVAVDAGGAPTGCTVEQGSGTPSLDEATCRLISQRARFNPAKDAKGRPVAGTYATSVRWVIPEGPAAAPVRLPPLQLIAPAYCVPIWKGDEAAALVTTAIARCGN